jgi:hypothetical protein
MVNDTLKTILGHFFQIYRKCEEIKILKKRKNFGEMLTHNKNLHRHTKKRQKTSFNLRLINQKMISI